MAQKSFDHPINALWRPSWKHFFPLALSHTIQFFSIIPIFFDVIYHDVCWACSIPIWIHIPHLKTTTGSYWRPKPWIYRTTFSNGYGGPTFQKMYLLSCLVLHYMSWKYKKYCYLVVFISCCYHWTLPYSMDELMRNIVDEEPTCLDEASKKKEWMQAVIEEYQSIIKNDV